MIHRRNFIKQLSAAGILSTIPEILLSMAKPADKIWACLLHLSFNSLGEAVLPDNSFRSDLIIDESLWNDALKKMVAEGMNMVVIDLGDAIKYESHPEIAIRNAWTVSKLRAELKKIRKMGLEPIPQLNFSAANDAWLKDYSRMLSTDEYYSVCEDLIKEVATLFDKPRFFHLGMNDEEVNKQADYDYVVVRRNHILWADFDFLIAEVEKNGGRPWIWSDYLRRIPEQFYKNMPKSVVQSNWQSTENFDAQSDYAKTYLDLETYKYDQISTLSYLQVGEEKSMINTVEFCNSHIADSRLLGFLQTSSKPKIEKYREHILEGIHLAGNAKKSYELRSKRAVK